MKVTIKMYSNSWIEAMEKNLDRMEELLDDKTMIKHKDIQNNREHLNSRGKSSSE